jgi:hypothetical protein
MSARGRKPLWRAVVDRADRLVTPAANSFVRTDTFADAVSAFTRLEVRLRRRIDRQMSWLLHLYGMPSTLDMRRVLTHLASIEARLRDVAERLDDLEAEQSARPRERARKS